MVTNKMKKKMLNKKSIIFLTSILLGLCMILFMNILKNSLEKNNEKKFNDFQLYQNDYSYVMFGNSNLAVNGSSVIALSMVINNLSSLYIEPENIAYWDGYMNYFTENNELDLSFIQATIKHFNRQLDLDIECTETNNINEVVSNIKNGAFAISAQRKGIFTETSHFIVLYDIDKNGKIKIKDPNRNNAKEKRFNYKTFTPEQIDTSSIKYWIFTKN